VNLNLNATILVDVDHNPSHSVSSSFVDGVSWRLYLVHELVRGIDPGSNRDLCPSMSRTTVAFRFRFRSRSMFA
jgi:hypothetical protein